MAVRQDASTGELVSDEQTPLGGISVAKSKILQVKVWSPFQVYFSGEAASASGVNAAGPFDILPQHHNFISLLTACELVLQPQGGEVRIRISGGVMQVHDNMVTVFLEV